MNINVTSISSKGQIVIPNTIRKEMGLSEGTKLIVMSDGKNLLLKPIELPKIQVFNKLIKKSRDVVNAMDLSKNDLKSMIKEVRDENNL